MGWQFVIALTNRMGTGLVYSDEYFDDEEARRYFLYLTRGKNMRQPRLLKWKPGRLEKPNVGNTYAIGMAAGFIDPLEANAVVSAICGMKQLAWTLKGDHSDNYYNKAINYYLDDIADFTAVHYTLSCNNIQNDFWTDARLAGLVLNHRDLVRDKYYNEANSIEGVVGYRTAFPDVTWLDIANNWIQDLSDWPSRSTLEQQKEYIMSERRKKWFHRRNSYRNQKSIESFMQMYNNEKEYSKGLNVWPDQYFREMFGT